MPSFIFLAHTLFTTPVANAQHESMKVELLDSILGFIVQSNCRKLPHSFVYSQIVHFLQPTDYSLKVGPICWLGLNTSSVNFNCLVCPIFSWFRTQTLCYNSSQVVMLNQLYANFDLAFLGFTFVAEEGCFGDGQKETPKRPNQNSRITGSA